MPQWNLMLQFNAHVFMWTMERVTYLSPCVLYSGLIVEVIPCKRCQRSPLVNLTNFISDLYCGFSYLGVEVLSLPFFEPKCDVLSSEVLDVIITKKTLPLLRRKYLHTSNGSATVR